jgi:hypothetical protein
MDWLRSIKNTTCLISLLLLSSVSMLVPPEAFAQIDDGLQCSDPNLDSGESDSQVVSNFPMVNLFPRDNREPSAFAPGNELVLPNRASEFSDGLRLLPVQGKVYMLMGAGGNITLQIRNERTEDGVLLVDTGTSKSSEDVLAAIRQITTAPIRLIINSSDEEQHTGGKLRAPLS